MGSIAYVELEDNNGGIVLNISEGGLSLTSVGVLDVEHPPRIRVQLPRSRDWLELPGEFAWVSESKKEAGIRFSELTREAGIRIKNWILSEASPAEISRESDHYAETEIPAPVNPNNCAPEPSVLQPEASRAPAPEELLVPSMSLTPDAPEIATKEADPQPVLQGAGTSTEAEGTDNSSWALERRVRARCRIKSLVYIELGKSNCGIVVNISENGLYLEAAVALIGDHVPLMRFQLPHSRKWIETSGKVVWTSESRRKVGIQFVDLPTDEQAQMKEWISLEGSRAQVPAPTESVREKYGRPRLRRIAHAPESQILGPSESDKSLQTPTQSPVRSAIPASTSVKIKVLGSASALSAKAPRPVAGARQTPRATGITGWLTSGTTSRGWRTLAPPIALIAVLSFVVGWFAARQRAGNNITQIAAVTAEATSESKKRAELPATTTDAHPSSPIGRGAARQGDLDLPTPENRSASVPVVAAGTAALPATTTDAHPSSPIGRGATRQGDLDLPTPENRSAGVPVVAAGTAGPAGHGAQRPLVRSASKVLNRAAESVRLAARSLAPSVTRPAAKVLKPIAKGTPSPPQAGSAAQSIQPVMASPSPAPNRPEAAAAVATKPKESATPTPKLPETAAIPGGSVLVNYLTVPSIRVPPELKSQSSQLARSLQIGQLISRVDPVYPKEVRRQRIEGTVSLHAVIGRDGAVQSVELLSGPPMLAPLAMSAIRQWHFKQTLLGGEPIETEQDITFVFRLTNPAIRSN